MPHLTAILLILLAYLIPSTSWAGLEFCNATDEKILFSVMYKDDEKWMSRGWIVVEAGACKTPIAEINQRYYYVHAKSAAAVVKPSGAKYVTGCVSSKAFKLDSTNECLLPDTREVNFFSVDTKKVSTFTYTVREPFSASGQGSPQVSASTPSASAAQYPADFEAQACKVLYQNLPRPKLRSAKIPVGHYTDIFTPPQLKTECTNVYDTGVPDPSTCRLEHDSCASKWHGPFGSWGCIPGVTNRCTNIKACNTWAHYKKSMECDVLVQLKLPNFIEKPLTDYIDEGYRVIDSTRASLPLACVPPEIRQNAPTVSGEQIAQAVSRQVQKRIREEVEREAREWVQETAITTIAAAIPSGGIGGAAAMATSLSTFVYRTYTAVEPIVRYVNQAKDFAEDLGFSTSCGWNNWHRY